MFSFCKKWNGSCTCFLDKLFNKDWSECCKQHDEDYINLKDGDSTKPSDIKFLECLKKKSWKPIEKKAKFEKKVIIKKEPEK